MWCAGVVGLVASLVKYLIPALRFGPSLTSIALRVESTDAGASTGLRGVLASGLELAASRDSARAAPVVSEASQRLEGLNVRDLFSSKRLGRVARGARARRRRRGGAGGVVPRLASIGLERVVTPWTSAEWPKLTEIVSATPTAPHPRGSGLVLRALLVKNQTLFGGSRDAEDARIVGKYRLLHDGHSGPVRRSC
jgi:hypothetical protein